MKKSQLSTETPNTLFIYHLFIYHLYPNILLPESQLYSVMSQYHLSKMIRASSGSIYAFVASRYACAAS